MVQEGFWIGGDAHDDGVGDDGGAAVTAAVAAFGLADHRGRLAGHGRLVHQGCAGHHVAAAGDRPARLDQDQVPLRNCWRRPGESAAELWFLQLPRVLTSLRLFLSGRPEPCRAGQPGQGGEDDRQPGAKPKPCRQRGGSSLMPASDRTKVTRVMTLAISTQNMTGLRQRVRGSSFQWSESNRAPP